MVSGAAQGLLSLEARKLVCLEPECDPFSRLGPSIVGQVNRDLAFFFSVVSLEPGDSDPPQQSQRTEEFVVVFTMRIKILLSGVG